MTQRAYATRLSYQIGLRRLNDQLKVLMFINISILFWPILLDTNVIQNPSFSWPLPWDIRDTCLPGKNKSKTYFIGMCHMSTHRLSPPSRDPANEISSDTCEPRCHSYRLLHKSKLSKNFVCLSEEWCSICIWSMISFSATQVDRCSSVGLLRLSKWITPEPRVVGILELDSF